GNDPRVRREAAQLFRQVADIYYALGQAEKAAKAFGDQAGLLATLAEEEPNDKDLRFELADSQRWRGDMVRDLGKGREAREAYDGGVGLLEPSDEPRYQAALANTLLNRATLFSRQKHATELEPLYRRIVALDRAAVEAAAKDPVFQEELALALGDQGV